MTPLMPLTMMPLAALAAASPESPGPWRVYLGTYAQGEAMGIHLMDFDAASGALAPRGRVCETQAPSFLATHPGLPVLYSVGETVRPEGAVSAWRIDGKTGELRLINQRSSKGGAPCHLAVAPSGRHVAVANYVSGSVALFPIEEDGGLGEASAVVQHEGSGPNAARQEGPHAHSVNFGPEGKRVYAADLGIDQVRMYDYDPGKGALTPSAPASVPSAPGAGPRHLSFHPSGRFLYASNRGHDSIAVFSLDDPGSPRKVGHVATGGKTPRNFALDPSGRYLLAANQESNNVVVFRVHPETGLPEATGEQAACPKPVCVLFVASCSN